MAVVIDKSDELLLLEALKRGEAFIVLGAGASATSTTPDGSRVLQGGALARLLAERAGLSYENEALVDVLGATVPNRISAEQFHRILREKYTKVIPSSELSRLFEYTWRRVYTWNIDDAVENVVVGVQRRRYFNGLIDKVVEDEGLGWLHVVHLHGEATKPGHGVIFSQSDYNARLNTNKDDWYKELAKDYAAYTPIFIGSRLNEPIFSAELDRARPGPDAGLGLAFLVTPDKFTAVQAANFKSRNIVVINATLEEFAIWLREALAKSVTPKDVARELGEFAALITASIELSPSDLDVANSILPLSWQKMKIKADSLEPNELKKKAREFLEGGPPSWILAATKVPVWLDCNGEMYSAFVESVVNRDRIFATIGQSGSGKTTGQMQILLKYLREHADTVAYILKPNVPSLQVALRLIRRLHKDQHVLVFAGDAYIYGDSLYEDVMEQPAGAMTLVVGARSNEWASHIERRVGDVSRVFKFQRFGEKDYGPLTDRLLEYVPAPKLKRMSRDQRIALFRKSQSQLLIALREATDSEKFTKVITDEYDSLGHNDYRLLSIVTGIPTIARPGISDSKAREVYAAMAKHRSYSDARLALDGIVLEGSGGRLFARHELYIRHIIENVASFDLVIDAIIELLRTYTRIKNPIVKNVGRLDALLFKFLLNHNFVAEMGHRRGEMEKAIRIYEAFEVEFQLDGHFWLQYGQFLARLGHLSESLVMFRRSIEAYPNNAYAAHAYADAQLQVAAGRGGYDSVAIELIGDAVRTLEGLHARLDLRTDNYPIVTLAHKHIGALVQLGQDEKAKLAAQKYFKLIESMAKKQTDVQLSTARERLAHFVALGTWEARSF